MFRTGCMLTFSPHLHSGLYINDQYVAHPTLGRHIERTVFYPDFWTAHESTVHIYYLSVSINILNLILSIQPQLYAWELWQQLLVYGQQKVCDSLCQFALVITSL